MIKIRSISKSVFSNRNVPLKVFTVILLLLSLTLELNADTQKGDKSIETYNIILPKDATLVLQNIGDIMERHISNRSSAQRVSDDSVQLSIELIIDQKLGSETFRITNGKQGVIQIYGGDERGVLYGVGKLLHISRYEPGFIPGEWRGTSAPECPLRVVYLATHFYNYYEAAPIEEVVNYIQDLGLWGYNSIFIAYPAPQFNGMEDNASKIWIKRFKTILASAKQCGLQVGLMQSANQGYKNAPENLRATPVPGNRRGNNGVNLCTDKPEARETMLNMVGELLDQFSNVGLDYYTLWPYDEGGCASSNCWPWGARGFLKISKELVALVHKKFPDCKIILSTWCFENENDDNPDGEWVGLEKSLRQDVSWVDYIMADGHDDYFPKYLLEHDIPGNLPLINFPEISMFGMHPWGGYGVNPAPRHFQKLWDRIKDKASGGVPYSEGIYEDINKIIIAGFYWSPDKKAEKSIKEYLAFEFSPDIADDMLEIVRIYEQNHNRKNIQKSAIRAYDLVKRADTELPDKVRSSWRWRIFYLRALIDKELYERKGVLEGESLKAAFSELTRLYHAENSHTMPIRPPVIE